MAKKKVCSINKALEKHSRPIESLKVDPDSPRLHDERNLDAIKASLQGFSQQKPIVVSLDGTVIAGNAMLESALALGWTHIAAVVFDKDEPGMAAAYGIADNRTTDLSTFDDATLARILEDLGELESDLDSLTGFNDEEISRLLDAVREPIVEDEIPDRPDNPVTKLGDVWKLGSHRLVCGDCTDASISKAFRGRFDCLVTDPPYGVSYVGGTKDKLTIKNDSLSEPELTKLISASFGIAETVCRPGAYWYATVPAGPLHLLFAQDWKTRGVLRQILVWTKDSMVLGRSEYHYMHEPILFGWLPNGDRLHNPDRTRVSVWDIPRPKRSVEHPTMKPVELFARAILDSTKRGDKVYDPFLGSGTTLIAAEQADRVCGGVELDPAFCDVICQRWTNLTGRAPVLERNL